MPKFRKLPVVIEALKLTRPMRVDSLEGSMRGNPGDWLIVGVKGEQYFCKDDIFRLAYEPVDTEAKNYLLRVRAQPVETHSVKATT